MKQFIAILLLFTITTTTLIAQSSIGDIHHGTNSLVYQNTRHSLAVNNTAKPSIISNVSAFPINPQIGFSFEINETQKALRNFLNNSNWSLTYYPLLAVLSIILALFAGIRAIYRLGKDTF
ncbi:MAG: hypothetical protein AB8B74_01465 [Crocinitomicaceae bacterium]